MSSSSLVPACRYRLALPRWATVKVDPVVLGTEHLAIGEEPLRVEQLCQVTNTLIDRQT